MEGWIKLHRRLLKHWIWKNDQYFKAWTYCLFRANHVSNKILIGSKLEPVERGQFITSIGNFAKDTGMTLQGVRTFWNLLETDKMISKESTSKSTKLTICNYDSYQLDQQTNNKPVTNEQQTGNKPVTTDKKVKKEKNDKEKNIPQIEEFVNYAKENKSDVNIEAVKLKYKSWVENNWCDGNNKEIKNWKTKLLNTLSFLPEVKGVAAGTNLNAGQDRSYEPPEISESALTREEYLAQKDKT